MDGEYLPETWVLEKQKRNLASKKKNGRKE